MSNEFKRSKKDRVGPDFWVKWIKFSSVFCWVIFFIILCIIDRSKPPYLCFIDRMRNTYFVKPWDLDLVQYAFYLLIFLLFFCIFSLIVNSKRHKRKSDSYSISLVVLCVFSLIGIIVYTVSFLL